MALSRARIKTIFSLSLPIIGGMVSQNILNLVDTAMVGHLGDNALAAVGICGFLVFLCSALSMGLSSGVQAMSARLMGRGESERTAIPLNGGLLLALGISLPMTALMITLAPDILPYVLDDVQVQEIGLPYLQIRLAALLGIGINFVFRGYWNGVNLSKVYMRTLIVMHVVNAALNYVLIFGKFGLPEMGIQGAAIGTVVSLYVGSAYYLVQGWMYAREAGFASGLPDRSTMLSMVKLSVPSGVQNFFFAAGLTTFFSFVGHMGTKELAASQVLVNLMLVGLLPGIGFGLAGASLVGQALGREAPEEAAQWGVDVARLAMGLALLLIIPVVIFPDPFLSVFLKEPDTLALARNPLRLIAAALWLDLGGVVLMNALLGAGDNKKVMVVSIALQWGLNLPLIYFVGPYMQWGLLAVWGVQSGYKLLQGLIFLVIWKVGRWKTIKL